MQVLTLVCADERIELSHERATHVTDYLWTGRFPGSAVCALKLTEALARPEEPMRGLVEFEPSEWPAICGALDALGVPR
jgi:hypothetical protein